MNRLEAISKMFPERRFSIRGSDFDDLSAIRDHDGKPIPSEGEVDAFRASYVAPPESALVPESVTPRQFRLALLSVGISPASIDAALVGNEAALVEWQYALEVMRDHPMVNGLAKQLGKSSDDLDGIFRMASTL